MLRLFAVTNISFKHPIYPLSILLLNFEFSFLLKASIHLSVSLDSQHWLVAATANDIIECWPSEMWYVIWGEWWSSDPRPGLCVNIPLPPLHVWRPVFVRRILARGGFSATCTARGANNKIFSRISRIFPPDIYTGILQIQNCARLEYGI